MPEKTTKEKITEVKQIYFMDDFKAFMRKMQDLTDEDSSNSVPRIIEKILKAGEKNPLRMIPNACSIINHGYNPVTFSPSLDEPEKKELQRILAILGDCPEVDEEKLEAYAILTAMGPTYLWFQLYELEKIGITFGLTSQEARNALYHMTEGSAITMDRSGLMPDEVMDLIPVKPLGEEEDNIKNIYHAKLEALYQNLKR
jgi:pyrroline-5-carboxylate reductase